VVVYSEVVHLCDVRTESDVDWAINRVLLGDRVVAHVGGLGRPQRHRLKNKVALCCLEARIEGLGGQVTNPMEPYLRSEQPQVKLRQSTRVTALKALGDC